MNALPQIQIKADKFDMNWDLKLKFDYSSLISRLSTVLSKSNGYNNDNSLYFATIRLVIIININITYFLLLS